MTRTVVIGAGVAGLATAALLAREGHQVTVLERRPEIGGRAGSLERDGFRFDVGPSWYLLPRVFDHFFEMLGTSTEEQLDLRLLDPAYTVFSPPTAPDRAGAGTPDPFTVPLGEDEVVAAFEAREPGSGKVLQTYLASARRTTTMAERYFLYNPFTRLRSLLQPEVLGSLPTLVGLLLRSLKAHVAARFTDPVLRQVLGYPAVFLGTNPAAAPSMYHLMSALDLSDGVQYPQGGFWELVQRLAALAEEQGAVLTTGADVQTITTARRGGRRRATGVTWRDGEGNLHHQEADVVVSAADLHHTETRLLGPGERTYPQPWWDRRTSGPGAVLVMLGVRGGLPKLPHHSLFFTADWDANFEAIFGKRPRVPDPASIYVCKPSQTDPDVAPAGHENLFVLVPVPADPGLGAGGPDGSGSPVVEKVADAAIAQVADWAGIPDLAERVVVRHTIGPADFADQYHSWQGGMLGPAHILSQSAMFRAQNASRKVDGLYYAGATTAPGVGVPMCLISAELVLKRIRGDHSPGPSPVQRPTARGSAASSGV